VGRLRRALGAAKVGHGGTLDPLATGVLPIAFGEATKVINFIVDADKRYRFTVRWGEARRTDDAEGAVVATSAHRPTASAIEAGLARWMARSSRSRRGATRRSRSMEKTAYALARARPSRPPGGAPGSTSTELVLVDLPDADHAVLEVRAQGHLRAQPGRDLAEGLGTVGHVSGAARLAVGPFRATPQFRWICLTELGHSAAALERFAPDFLTRWPTSRRVAVTGAEAEAHP